VTDRQTDRPRSRYSVFNNRLHLRNKWSKDFDDRPHHRGDFSLEKFNVTLDYLSGRPTETLVNSMRGNSDIRAT